MNTQTINFQMLPPEALLANKNIRFGLKKYRIDSMAQSILDIGKVEANLKVEPLSEPGPNGEKFLVRDGHYRHAAASKLNKEGASVMLPCEIEAATNENDRSKLQITANIEREDMSPMDMAVAIDRLIKERMAKVEISKLFSRPGGRKGLAMQPLSNAMLNIYLSFLEFPKKVQGYVHDGILQVADAYKLAQRVKTGVVTKEQFDAIIADAEAERQALMDFEDKLGAKLEEDEKKKADEDAKAKANQEALEKAKALADKAQEDAEKALEVAAYALKAKSQAKTPEEKAAANEAFKAQEAAAKTAEKAASDAAKEAQKLADKEAKRQADADERRKKLEDARKADSKKTPKLDTEKSTKKVTSGSVSLSLADFREEVRALCLPGSFPKVRLIALVIQKRLTGMGTPQSFTSELAYITGERKDRPKTFSADKVEEPTK